MTAMPVRRSEVLVEAVGGDFVAFHPGTATAHALTVDRARVWELCDGRMTVQQAARQLGLTDHAVEQSLAVLAQADLVAATEVTRRLLLQRTSMIAGGALVAAALPSVLAPSAAAAASSVFGPPGPALQGSTGSGFGHEAIPGISQGQFLQLAPGTVVTGFSMSASNSQPNGDIYYELRNADTISSAPAAVRVLAPGITTAGGPYTINGLHYVVPADGKFIFDVYATSPDQIVYEDYGSGEGGFAYYIPSNNTSHTYPAGSYNKIYTLFGFPPGSGLRRAGSSSAPVVLARGTQGDVGTLPAPTRRR